jgi:PAS domain S-box-containing protein
MRQVTEKTREELLHELEKMQDKVIELEIQQTLQQNQYDEIRKQKELLESVIDAITFRMYLIDPEDYTVKFANRAARNKITDNNLKCYSCIHGVDKPGGIPNFTCIIDQIKQTKKVVLVEHTIYNETGNPKYTEIQGFPVFDSEGNLAYILEAILSISKRKIIQQSLDESEQKYKKLFEEANDAILLIDADTGYILDANRKAEQLLGRTIEEIIGLHYTRLNVPEMTAITNVEPEIKNVLDFETEITRKDGVAVPVHLNTSVLTLQGKKLIQGIFKDITERKLAEIQLLDYQKELRALASELSLAEERERRHIATEVHDNITQTLAVCSMKLGALMVSAENDDRRRDVSEINTLIKKMIKETRELTFELSSPLLYEIGLEAAIEQLMEQLQEQYSIQFSFTHDGESNSIGNDVRVFLFQSIRELLMNTIKHSQARRVRVKMTEKDNHLRILVRDDGIGLDTLEINPKKKRIKGFGLFNIRERLTLLGGNLEISSGKCNGTEVVITVPLRENTTGDDGEK